MSFSTDIKNDLTRIESSKMENISELSAIVRNSVNDFEKFIINIENNAVARRLFKLFKEIYDVTPSITIRKRFFNKGVSFILTINNRKKEILRDLSIIDNDDNFINIPKEFIISDDDSLRAYLRGVFVSVGSINDPKTSRYHLEFMINDLKYAKFLNNVLNKNDLNSKIIKREKNYMVYIKESEKISDFLRIIKAYNAVMYYEDIRIYRDHKNMTNRLNNCEQANIDKVFFTSSKQINDINILKEYDMIDMLDDKLKEVIDYRLKYPEYSLQELSDIIYAETNKLITKSGLNHRFRKIKEIVSKIKTKEGEK